MALRSVLLFCWVVFPVLVYSQSPVVNLKYEDGHARVSFLAGKTERSFVIDAVIPSTSQSVAQLVSADSSGIELKKEVKYFDHSCTITSKVKTTGNGIQWDIYIAGTDGDWTAPIATSLQWDSPSTLQFWTTWSDNHQHPKSDDWQDPFISAPFQALNLIYGGETHVSRDAFVAPVACTLLKEDNIGVSFAESLNDTILNLGMQTTATGGIIYQHNNYRIGSKRTIHISHQIVFHEADWRAAMAWFKNSNPTYFLPDAPWVNDIAGGGAYSSYEGALDTAKYRAMGFSINWKASLDFPYMGLFIPPVKSDDEKWVKYKQGGITVGDGYATIHRLNAYSERLNSMGFHTLSYFNVNEFGNGIVYPYHPTDTSDATAWENPNNFLYSKLKNAMLKPAGELPDWDERPLFSNWEGCVVLDPADPAYHALLLEQARLHIEKIPASSGICIDRLDWMRFYNANADDGISMVGSQKTRSLLTSWNGIITPVAQMMHAAHKVLFCNPLDRRTDLLQHIDGIYDEFGYVPSSLNLCAQMAFFKPLIAWTASKENLQADPDGYFQRHIYLGAFLTVPFPGNDHCITPDEWATKYYLDYGMFLNALKGREWILEPHIVEVKDDIAKANAFKVKDKMIVPVVFGGQAKMATVVVKLPGTLNKKNKLVIKILHPGQKSWTVLTTTKYTKTLTINVPMQRGCALISIG